MSEEKFTKGVWRVRKTFGTVSWFDVVTDGGICSSTEDVLIANSCRRHDARLIAAAPEMYQTIKDLLDAMDDVLNNAQSVPDCIVWVAQEEADKAKAVLKKARGEK